MRQIWLVNVEEKNGFRRDWAFDDIDELAEMIRHYYWPDFVPVPLGMNDSFSHYNPSNGCQTTIRRVELR